MALRPDILLNPQVVDAGQAVRSGLQTGRGIAQAPMQNRLLQAQVQQAEQQTQLGQMKMQQAGLEMADFERNRVGTALSNAFQNIEPFMESGDTVGAMQALGREYEKVLDNPVAKNAVLEAMQAIGSGDQEGIERVRTTGRNIVRQFPTGPKTGEKFSATTTTLDDGTTIQMTGEGRRVVRDPAGNVLQGEDAARAIRAAKEFGVDIQRQRAIARGEGKGEAGRVEAAINQGVDAAQGIPILKRSLSLLDEVKTGGFNATALKAKQFFGIEGADEAELSSNLGKSVLGQLKTVFGAQFTEKEGERLERIEASFGKSADGNKRLLQQTLRLAERAADRGIEAAIEREDYRAAQDIKELMDFSLSDEELSSRFSPPPSAAPVAQQFREGQTATNPETNERMVYRNGQWQSL